MTVDLVPEIGIDELVARYEELLFDAYGVLVHSEGALPGAAELIEGLHASGKPYYLLTNDASKLPATSAARYGSFGVPIPAECIITSGSLLAGYFTRHQLVGARCAVLGTQDSARYVEEAGGRVVPAEGEFEVLVIADEAGYPFLDTADAALSSLYRMLDAERMAHLLAPNPDLIYPSSETGFGFGAGSIAGMFESALGARYPDRPKHRFTRLGKPHAGLFDEALRRSGTRDMVMVGDQLATDIRGARSFGLDAAWVCTGVTAEVLDTTPDQLRPTYRLQSLTTDR